MTLTREGISFRPGDGRRRAVPTTRVQVGGNSIDIIESPTTRWLFDQARRRFLRLPRDLELDVGVLAMPWQRYTQVSLGDDGAGVVVTLDGGGLLRLHAGPLT